MAYKLLIACLVSSISLHAVQKVVVQKQNETSPLKYKFNWTGEVYFVEDAFIKTYRLECDQIKSFIQIVTAQKIEERDGKCVAAEDCFIEQDASLYESDSDRSLLARANHAAADKIKELKLLNASLQDLLQALNFSALSQYSETSEVSVMAFVLWVVKKLEEPSDK